MLKLQHIHKSFSSKVIFNDAEFSANSNELTILIGKSGTGKTTLFQIILNIMNCEYFYNNERIDVLDSKEKEKFILNMISYSSQFPTFIPDLTLHDHINLLKSIYQSDFDVTSLIELFKLRKFLDCYPNQLSGGEKSRFAFILALLKPARIYMFDEPTSALDDLQASHIVSVLNKLKENGNIVIISTHDHRLIEQGDKVYKIENNKILLTYHTDLNASKTKQIQNDYSLGNLFAFWYKMSKHNKIYTFCTQLLLSISIIIALCGIELGYTINKRIQSKINNESSQIITVFKQANNTLTDFSETSMFFPFSHNDLEKLDTIEHIKNFDFNLTYPIFGNITLYHDYNSSYTPKVLTITLNDYSNSLTFDSDNPGDFSTYPDNINFDYRISQKWNDTGLYVNENFYNDYLKDIVETEDDKKNIVLTFPLYIPQYLENGSSYIEESATNNYAGTYIYANFNIKGVMKEDTLIDYTTLSDYTFALSNKEMQNYLNQYKKTDYQSCIFHSTSNEVECGNEKSDYQLENNSDFLFSYSPLQHTAILIEVDKPSNVDTVCQELRKNGFDIFNHQISNTSIHRLNNTVRNNILHTSITLFFIIIFMNIILKMNNIHDEYSFTQFFKEKGFTKHMIQTLKKQKYLVRTFDITKNVIILSIIVNIIWYFYHNTFLLGTLSNLFLGFILIIMIEFFIPLLLEKTYFNLRYKKR